MRKAVVLLSGGLDSATTLALAKANGFQAHAITFRYGQRHQLEVAAARRVARAMGVAEQAVVDIDLRMIGKSALTADIAIPKNRSFGEMGDGIPVTYVPARNTIFLSFALAWAETIDAFDIFTGMNMLDYAGYPDCRPEYVAAFETMANLATKVAVEGRGRFSIHTPLIHWTKAEIIRKGLSLGVDYSLTTSCYDPVDDRVACRCCDACRLRLQGFAENGTDDPVTYRSRGRVTT